MIEKIGNLITFWKPLPIFAPDMETLLLYRGDSLTIHHPLPLLDRISLKIHGITLKIN